MFQWKTQDSSFRTLLLINRIEGKKKKVTIHMYVEDLRSRVRTWCLQLSKLDRLPKNEAVKTMLTSDQKFSTN